MEIAAFNDDKADELLLKRCPANALAIVAPWVDIRHWQEREEKGTYEVDEVDKGLLDLALDIQYRTQHHYFGALARSYFDEQMKEAIRYSRRSTRFEMCFQQLPEHFTTEQFAKIFGHANPHASVKTLESLVTSKAIQRTKRGEYKKMVSTL